MIEELLLVHHSHTDIGYTHPQPVIFELHHRFIEMALDIAEASQDEREDARFRWTCEVTGTTRAWWDSATLHDRERFLAAVRRGQIEVAAMEWHLTPLADLRMLIRSMENVKFFRELGVPIRSAMNTDVNGVPWGLVDVLLDHGIDGFSMSSNSHFGAPVHPRPGAFRWASPEGREITVWNGFQYWHTANGLLGMPNAEAFAEKLPNFIRAVEERGYPLSYLPLQITDPNHPDNATPDASIGRFVREWNDSNPTVRLRTALLSDVFDRLRQESLPVAAGDWTDYWNFGAGSSSRETTVLAEGLRTLDAAQQVSAWPGTPETRQGEHLDHAHVGLSLYAEHTWGADRSVSEPESLETRMQWATKSAYVFQGLGHARIVMRDGLRRLAQRAGGEETSILLYNSLPVPLNTTVSLPVANLDWATNPGIPHVQRLDSSLSDLPEANTKWCSVEVPAFGYCVYPVEQLPVASSNGLSQDGLAIASDRVKMQFGEAGGVQSLVLDGVEYVGQTTGFSFGVPVLEHPKNGSRREIMNLDFTQIEPADGWVRDWPRTTLAGELVEQIGRVVEGCVEHVQRFMMANGDRVEVLYRLFAGDPSVDLAVTLQSVGRAEPYSLALPFVLPSDEARAWHFDTAGAVVEFDREQLPNAARHYVTARRFVRMQSGESALSVATPDLPLWMFCGMNMAPSTMLSADDRQSVMLAWLANNYWEVNFLANQVGSTRYHMRLIPHRAEPVGDSMARALPHCVPPKVHAYRGMGPQQKQSEALLEVIGNQVNVDALRPDGDSLVFACENTSTEPNTVEIRPSVRAFSRASRARLDGTGIVPLQATEGGFQLQLAPRELVGVRLS